eukprot:2420033-Rhodomonas_salina.1
MYLTPSFARITLTRPRSVDLRVAIAGCAYAICVVKSAWSQCTWSVFDIAQRMRRKDLRRLHQCRSSRNASLAKENGRLYMAFRRLAVGAVSPIRKI